MTEQINLNGYEKRSRTFATSAETKIDYDSVSDNPRFPAKPVESSDIYGDDMSILTPRVIARMPDLTGFSNGTTPSSISLFRAKHNRFSWSPQMLKKISLKKLCGFGAVCCVISALIWCLFANNKEDAPATADFPQTNEEMKIQFTGDNQAAILQADASSRETPFSFAVQETSAPPKLEFSSMNTNAVQPTFMSNDFFASQSIVPADASPTPFSVPQQDALSWNYASENQPMPPNVPYDMTSNNSLNNTPNVPVVNQSFAGLNVPISNNNPNPYYAANPNNGNTMNYSGNGNYAPQPNFSDVSVYNPYPSNMTQPVTQAAMQPMIQPTSFQDYNSSMPMQNNQNVMASNNDVYYQQPMGNPIQPSPQFQDNRMAYDPTANAIPPYSAYPQNNGMTSSQNYSNNYALQQPAYSAGQPDYAHPQYQGNYPPNAMTSSAANPNGIAPNIDARSNVPMVASAQSFRNQNATPMNNMSMNNNNAATMEQNPAYGGNTFNNSPVILSQTPEYYK
ncbi:MAG: hypothetical protein LBJ67_02845 [Planctomycetaceae bacterium]|nr:hypothetical protein [Planctomycetaceae bacterium]